MNAAAGNGDRTQWRGQLRRQQKRGLPEEKFAARAMHWTETRHTYLNIGHGGDGRADRSRSEREGEGAHHSRTAGAGLEPDTDHAVARALHPAVTVSGMVDIVTDTPTC